MSSLFLKNPCTCTRTCTCICTRTLQFEFTWITAEFHIYSIELTALKPFNILAGSGFIRFETFCKFMKTLEEKLRSKREVVKACCGEKHAHIYFQSNIDYFQLRFWAIVGGWAADVSRTQCHSSNAWWRHDESGSRVADQWRRARSRWNSDRRSRYLYFYKLQVQAEMYPSDSYSLYMYLADLARMLTKWRLKTL